MNSESVSDCETVLTDDGLAMNCSATPSEDLGGRRPSNRGTNVAVTGNRIDIKVCKNRVKGSYKEGIYYIRKTALFFTV